MSRAVREMQECKMEEREEKKQILECGRMMIRECHNLHFLIPPSQALAQPGTPQIDMETPLERE